jgi:hypothetical protein
MLKNQNEANLVDKNIIILLSQIVELKASLQLTEFSSVVTAKEGTIKLLSCQIKLFLSAYH